MLALRSRIEFLQKLLWPIHKRKPDNRYETWLDIMELDDPAVRDLLNEINQIEGLTVDWFCRAISIIYGDFNDRAAHDVPLPPNITDEDISYVTTIIKVKDDEPIKETIKILIRSFRLIPSPPDSNESSVGFDRSADSSNSNLLEK